MSSRTGSICRRLLHGTIAVLEVLLLVGGLVVLGGVLLALIESGYIQRVVRTEMDRVTAVDGVPHPGAGADVAVPRPPDWIVGELTIPRLQLSTAALEGDSAANLRLGIGHLPDTPMPWQTGNSAFAGHRDTFFRALGSLREGDRIEVATSRGRFEYIVRHLLIVNPDEVWVLNPALASLTLITCYPFTYVGSAPQRFVVQADRAELRQPAGIPGR